MRCTPFDQLRSALTAPGSGQRFRSEHLTPAPLLPGEGFGLRFPKPPGSEAQPSPAGATRQTTCLRSAAPRGWDAGDYTGCWEGGDEFAERDEPPRNLLKGLPTRVTPSAKNTAKEVGYLSNTELYTSNTIPVIAEQIRGQSNLSKEVLCCAGR